MASGTPAETLDVDGREVRVSNPDKVYFPEAGITKLELVRYYLEVAEGAVRAVYDRPIVLKRYVDGITGEGFFQKRAPAKRPDWVPTVELRFPSGRTAHELVVTEAAQLAWMANLGNIDLNPHAVRTSAMEHPDELRIDLDPCPGVPWEDVRRIAAVTREVLEENHLVGWPKTSGSRGMHVYARIQPRWGFTEVRRAALAVSREVERRAPGLATSKWWKEERVGVFLDYNQNAKDRTIAAAYSVRPNQRAMVSAPLTWDEVPACDPADFTLRTMPARLRDAGDPAAGMDEHPGSLESLLEVSARHEEEGLGGDAPWPPHFGRQPGEPRRVNPSRRRKGPSPTGRRRSVMPLIVIAQAKTEAEAQAGLDRWRARHPQAAACLQPDDVLVDAMRGRHSVWTRIRVNLRHVPEAGRPPQEPPDPDYDPSVEWNPPSG
ncbi:MAG: non-homologous end-joining DNA ligase [Spirochaetaceae bacterium]|nr:non-homologous end-joining DNA ligase [Spirochaetaceae bacterium]